MQTAENVLNEYRRINFLNHIRKFNKKLLYTFQLLCIITIKMSNHQVSPTL